MELLLFALAILFSIFSALMERRKRRKRLEEAQQQHTETDQQHAEVSPAAPVVAEEKKEEEPSFGWPFDGDPFEEPVLAEVDPAEAEREAIEAERQALEAERRAVLAEKLAMERLTETTRLSSPKSKSEESDEKQRPRRTRSHWFLTPQTARDAIVYMEILGKPKSEREEW